MSEKRPPASVWQWNETDRKTPLWYGIETGNAAKLRRKNTDAKRDDDYQLL